MAPLAKAAETNSLWLPLGWGGRQVWLYNCQGSVRNENVDPLSKMMKDFKMVRANI